ncbi:hypothetical protein EVAR_5095_1 [Eumeta japonica]|uniref:Uncharacterized protein n=1 Tax=Eumeta variegata TaxID=151549 RepID=A0A4C1SWY4_EUMVA|nr:hypothetical protein EVAR_5095_1 [Eumeta japonica]
MKGCRTVTANWTSVSSKWTDDLAGVPCLSVPTPGRYSPLQSSVAFIVEPTLCLNVHAWQVRLAITVSERDADGVDVYGEAFRGAKGAGFVTSVACDTQLTIPLGHKLSRTAQRTARVHPACASTNRTDVSFIDGVNADSLTSPPGEPTATSLRERPASAPARP